MKNILIITSLLLLHGNLFASSLGRIKDLKSESDNESSLISVMLKGQVSKKNIEIEEHGTFIQIKIPNATVLEPGKFYEGNSPFIRKIAIFDLNSNVAGIRLFVTQETSSIVGSVSTEVLKDRVLIHLNHRTVKALDSESIAKPATVVSKKEIESTNAAQHVKNALSTKSVSHSSLKEKLIYTSVISGIFLLLGLCSLVMKRFIPRRKDSNGDVLLSPMKTLATHPLAPKQNLTLVEVASQKILLAVSPDGISYLTTIEENKVKTQISQNQSVDPAPARPIISRPAPKLNPTLDSINRSTENKVESVAERILNRAESPKDSVQTKIKSNRKDSSRSIEDVTNLIRSKLKDLPTV